MYISLVCISHGLLGWLGSLSVGLAVMDLWSLARMDSFNMNTLAWLGLHSWLAVVKGFVWLQQLAC
jgi:hypothetical protein